MTAPQRPHTMITEFPSGLVIGWDTCRYSNGGCGLHVSKCSCKNGPKEPAIFERWRKEEQALPKYHQSAGSTPASPVKSEPEGAATATGAMVPCALGQHLVPLDQAERNDDGSFSCFSCQEAS